MCGYGDILYVDERIIVLSKPTSLLSVPGIGPDKADCLVRRVKADYPGARIVHRLDRDTSGVIVLGLDAEAHRNLSIQFQERQTEKTYLALVAGEMNATQGEIDLPIRKDLDHPPRQMIDHEQGRWAVTNWRLLEHNNGISRLELMPVTGRSHQLRLHLREIGHPILGDDLYAPPDVLAKSDRLMLHAMKLSLTHPESAALMTFEAPVPF